MFLPVYDDDLLFKFISFIIFVILNLSKASISF